MDRPDPSSLAVPLLRGVAVAAWTWVAFAAVSASILVRFAEQLPVEDLTWLPSTFPDAFLGVLTFDVGPSILYQRPANDLAFTALPTTLLLLGQAGVVASVLAGALVVLSRKGSGARRFAEVFGYLGAFPVPVLLFGCYALGTSTGWAWLSPGAGGLLGNWLEATVLALPIAAAVGRVLVRETRNRRWLIDAWLFGSWVLGSVVFVESFTQIPGLGFFFIEALHARDTPLVVVTAAILVLVGLLGVVVRELVLSPASRGRFGHADAGTDATVPDGGVVVSDPGTVLRDDRRVQAGTAVFGLLLVVGLVGDLLVYPDTAYILNRSPVRAAVDGIAVTTVAAAGVAAVASVLGVAFGLLSARVRFGRTVSAVTVGLAANVPLLVLVWFALSTPDLPVPTSVWLGIAVSPPVALAVERGIAGHEEVSLAALRPAFGVAVTGAAVATLVLAQYHVLALQSPLNVTGLHTGVAVARLAVAVGLPVLSLFLLGEGLRRR